MKFTISVLIVGLVICPFINATASPQVGTSSAATNANVTATEPVQAAAPSPLRAESKSAVEDDEDDDFDLSDIMSIFGGAPQEYAHVKRSSNDYYVDMDMAASSPKEHQYQWKTVQTKPSGANKKSTVNNNGQLKSGNGKVYTLHIVTDGEHENGSSKGGNNNHHGSQYGHNSGGSARIRSPRSKIHVIPVSMRSVGKSDRGKARIVKRFRGTRPDDHHVKYDSHSHSEEIQDIILPAESEAVGTKYEHNYDIVGPKDLKSNDLNLAEQSENPESQYMDHDPYDPAAEKVKVKHHHHHHHHNHVKTVIKKVPQPYPVEKIVHVPVEKIVHVPKPYPVDKFVEKVVHVPVERVIQVPRPVPVDRIVEKVVHVPKPYPVDRIVEKPVPVNRPVRVNVPFPVEKIIHVPKPYPVEKIVEKIVHVPVIKHIRIPVPVEVKVPYMVNKPYPVKVEVEKQVPIQVEKKVPYPVKVEVEKKVPYPVRVYIPKPYPVEKKVVDNNGESKKNTYGSIYGKNRYNSNSGAHSYQTIQHGGNHQYGTTGHGQYNQGQASSQQQFDASYGSQLTAMDYGYSQGQQQQQQQQQQEYPYQFEQASDMQYGVNVMAAQQPTGQETEQQDYVYNTNDQSQASQMMGPSGSAVADSADAASSDSVVNVQSGESAEGSSFQINVPEQQQSASEPQFGESKTVSHLLQITPFTADKAVYTRPVDQFVVFHTGTGFAVPKRK